MLDVLLVDDEPLVLEGLRTMIDWEKRGYRVCGEAGDGADALAFIRTRRPHVVVTDIRMPVLSGLQLIEQAKQLVHAPPKFVILSGYDDFHYAQTAMRHEVSHYLLKPIDDEEMDRVLQRLTEELAEESRRTEEDAKRRALWLNRAVKRMIRGEYDAADVSCLRRLFGASDREEIACVVIERMERSFPEAEIEAWKKDVSAWLAEHYPGQCLHLFADGIGRLILIVRGAAGTPERLAAGLLSGGAASLAGSDCAVYISGSRPGIEALKDVYEEALAARHAEWSRGKPPGHRNADTGRLSTDMTVGSAELKELLQEIESGRAEEVRRRVLALVSMLAASGTSTEAVRLFARSLKLELMRLVSDLNADMEAFGSQLLSLDGGERPRDLQELERYLLELCRYTSSYLQDWRRSNEGNLPVNLIHYVNKHYNKKLQLQTVAEEFRLHPVYLGQLFKKSTGKPFNEYIHAKRIEEAKKLLRRSTMSLSDVAFSVGYQDPEYFARKFKALTKQSPASYRAAPPVEAAEPNGRREDHRE